MHRFSLVTTTLLLTLRISIVTTQRFYACDPNCVLDKCDEDIEDAVCVHIIEVDPDGNDVEFPSKCAFNCANKCYENQLRIKREGKCMPLHRLKSGVDGELTGPDGQPLAEIDTPDEDEEL